MKPLATILFAFALMLPWNPACAQQPPVPSGMHIIDLQYVHNVSVAELSVGKKVELRLMQDLKDGDTVLLSKGSSAWATVTALKNDSAERSVTLHFEDLTLSDGRHAPLWVVPGSHTLRYASHAQGVPIMAFAGYDVFVKIPWPIPPAGTAESAPANERPGAASPSASNAPGGAASAVEIASTPAGADIEVDGAFVGNTPSTLNLPLGDHSVSVAKAGFVTWTRKVHVTSGDIRIVAELEKK